MSVDCSGELNPIVSPTESSRVGQLGPSPLLVALLSSQGCGSSGGGVILACGSEGGGVRGDKALSPCVPNKPAGSRSQLWLSGMAWKGRRGACRCSPGTKGLSMPESCGACRRPGEVLVRISAERVGRTPGDPALQGPCLDYLTIGRVGWCLSSPCMVAPGFGLSLSRSGLIRVT